MATSAASPAAGVAPPRTPLALPDAIVRSVFAAVSASPTPPSLASLACANARVCANDLCSIDFGTAGTGFAVLFPSIEMLDDPLKAVERIHCDREKEPTCLLLDAAAPYGLLAFGEEAQTKFASGEPGLFFHNFKMALSPDQWPSTRTVRAKVSGGDGTGSGEEVALPTQLLVTRALEHVKAQVMAFLAHYFKPPSVPSTRMVLTVPAIWGDAAKYAMRAAAVAAGLAPSIDSTQLVLALEPEAALLASLAYAAPPQRVHLCAGKRVMVMDNGGGTSDITTDFIEELVPLRVHEVRAPEGGKFGSWFIDRRFLAFLKEFWGEATYGLIPPSVINDAVAAFRSNKEVVGRKPPSSSLSFSVALSDMYVAAGVTKAAIPPLVAAYNSRHGYTDAATQLAFVERTVRLVLPDAVVRGFFDGVIGPLCDHVKAMLLEPMADGAAGVRGAAGAATGGATTAAASASSASAASPAVDTVVLVGGFSDCELLKAAVTTAVREVDARITVLGSMQRPGLAVLLGACIYGLTPIVDARIARFTYAYKQSDTFNPAIHDPRHKLVAAAHPEGLVLVLRPMVQKGQVLPAGFRFVKPDLVPLLPTSHSVQLQLFVLDHPIPNPRDPADAGKPPVVVVGDAGAAPADSLNPWVATADMVACIDVACGTPSAPRDQRRTTLEVEFGSSEVKARAYPSNTTGTAGAGTAAISYEDARVATARGGR